MGRYEYRYYNGERWTADVSVHGQRFVDPLDGAAAPAASFGPRPGWAPTAPVPARPGRGFAIAAFIIGLLSFVTGWVPFVFALAAVGALTAIVFGILALGRVRSGTGEGRGFAVTGIVLSVAAFGSAFIGFQLTRKVVDSFDEFIAVGEHTTTVTRCSVDGTIIDFRGTITNEDDRPHAYMVTVTYLLGRTVVDSDLLNVDTVEPGETATFEGTGIADDATPGQVPTCRIDTVTGPLPFAPDN
jgi:hypothetical protein